MRAGASGRGLAEGSGSAAQDQPGRNVAWSRDQRIDVCLAVQWRRGRAQALGAVWHGRVIDRLDEDPMALQQFVAGGFAERRVAGQDREDVAWAGHHPHAGFGQATL